MAAKVVIKPEIDEDDNTTVTNIDDFVTALEDCQESDEDYFHFPVWIFLEEIERRNQTSFHFGCPCHIEIFSS